MHLYAIKKGKTYTKCVKTKDGKEMKVFLFLDSESVWDR